MAQAKRYLVRRTLAIAAGVLALLGLGVVGASTAQAHTGSVSGVAVCSGGTNVVWTLTNDVPLTVHVVLTDSSGGGRLSGLPADISAAGSTPTSVRVDQRDLPSGTSTATILVTATWSDGFVSEGGASVDIPSDCTTPTPTDVTATAPSVTGSQRCDVQGYVTIPGTTGVSYYLGGRLLPAGRLAGPVSGTVTATADTGYRLVGQSSFPVDLPAAAHCATTVTVTALDPVVASNSGACGHPGTVTIPGVAHVSYRLNGAPVSTGVHTGPLTGTVTAVAEAGYTLTGRTSWSVVVVAATTCTTPPTCSTTGCATAAPPRVPANSALPVTTPRRATPGQATLPATGTDEHALPLTVVALLLLLTGSALVLGARPASSGLAGAEDRRTRDEGAPRR